MSPNQQYQQQMQQQAISIDPVVVASSASSQKTAVVESEFPADHHDEISWRGEWRRDHQGPYYHLFPVAAPRYPQTTYFPVGNPPAEDPPLYRQYHARLASETTARRSRCSCGGVPGWNLLVHGSPSRLTHIKGTVCVVLGIALIFIVVLVLALVSNRTGTKQ
ncbi:hypothetical protein F4678DRAFT_313564 [Xylaria arbuscula]|nr:hypothetical protein F4678DRAFT_313564 [Xylaria arbuscula]